ncbi:MAG: hypothetical protein CBD17_005365 [Cellvibrionales bacterium TMED157]|nr:MAG: hypothetical protein CBD17_005365 [Cellvibrionales bacterium TMED157]
MSTFRWLKRHTASITAIGVTSFMMISNGPALASESGNIESVMSAEERLKSGVDTLTAEQREFLNNWLQENYGRRTESVVTRTTTDKQSESTEQPAKLKAPPEAIEAEVDRRVAAKLADKRESEKAKQSDSAFEARLSGDFTGWTGKTIFKLDNGQVWRQRSSANYRHRGSDRRVTFKKNWMGGWEMTVVSSGKTVLVREVQ